MTVELHDFMCPAVAPSLSFPEMTAAVKQVPKLSGCSMAFEPRSGRIELKKKSLQQKNILSKEDFGDCRPQRLYQFHKQVARLNVINPVLCDFQDRREFELRSSLGKDVNVFQFNRRQHAKYAVLWRLPSYFTPDLSMGHVDGGQIDDQIPFDSKIPKMVFRGANSGSYWAPGTAATKYLVTKLKDDTEKRLSAERFSRLKAVFFSEENPEISDFKFAVSKAKETPELRATGWFADFMPPQKLVEYKYILCPNGNDVGTQLYWILKTNSIAFKEDCEYDCIPDYFLRPWVHYIPIARGLHDIKEKFEYCESNPDMCKQIILNANEAYDQMVKTKLWVEAEIKVLDMLGLLEKPKLTTKLFGKWSLPGNRKPTIGQKAKK